jgi:hypothetical protein
VADCRAYIIGSDGHFYSAVRLECIGDAEALKEAEHLVGGHDVELWQGARKVAAFKHKQETSRRAITYEIRDGRMIAKSAP